MPTSDRILIVDGPHTGISTYPRPVPQRLMCLDSDFCYHEYQRIAALHGVTRYRYLRRVGHPRWAAYAAKITRPANDNAVFSQPNRLS